MSLCRRRDLNARRGYTEQEALSVELHFPLRKMERADGGRVTVALMKYVYRTALSSGDTCGCDVSTRNDRLGKTHTGATRQRRAGFSRIYKTSLFKIAVTAETASSSNHRPPCPTVCLCGRPFKQLLESG